MLFMVRFTEKPESQAIRKEFLPAHLEWLERHAAEVLIAGSLRSEAAGPAVGALWIVEAPSRDAVEALMKEDPFWIHGLRQSYEILFCSNAFPERKIPV